MCGLAPGVRVNWLEKMTLARPAFREGAMTAFRTMWQLLVGKPLGLLDPRTRHAVAVTPLPAWGGLGADGLSSSCCGPEEAFLALARHTRLALFLALAAAAAVFVIALGYNPVIELFPAGGGARVATSLLGPKPRRVPGSGAAGRLRADGHEHLERLRRTIAESLDYHVARCRRDGIAADYRNAFGTNPVVECMNLASSTLDARCVSECRVLREQADIPARELPDRVAA